MPTLSAVSDEDLEQEVPFVPSLLVLFSWLPGAAAGGRHLAVVGSRSARVKLLSY